MNGVHRTTPDFSFFLVYRINRTGRYLNPSYVSYSVMPRLHNNSDWCQLSVALAVPTTGLKFGVK